MTSRTDKLGMSLDEIIKMNKKKPLSGSGSVISRATQQSRGRRIGKGKKNYQSNGNAVAVQGRFQGQGGRFNQVSYRKQFRTPKQGKFYGQNSHLTQYGRTATFGSKVQRSNNSYGSFQQRLRYRRLHLARNRIRLATRILNTRQWNRQQASRYWNSGSLQAASRVISTPRGFQVLAVRQRKAFRANKSMNSLHSDQIIRLQKQQAVQQKLNRTRALKSGWFKDKNSVTGSSDMLTVCIANDLAAKRLGHRQHANISKKFGGSNSYIRKYGRSSFTRHYNNDGKNSNNNYNPHHRSMSTTSRSSSVVDISPEGSIVTTVSQYSRASSLGRNQRAGPVIRGVRQNRAPPVEQYVPVTKGRSALNLQLQKEIAAIQGKPFQLSTNSMDFTACGSGSSTTFGLSGFKPVPSLTTTTLNERFSLAL